MSKAYDPYSNFTPKRLMFAFVEGASEEDVRLLTSALKEMEVPMRILDGADLYIALVGDNRERFKMVREFLTTHPKVDWVEEEQERHILSSGNEAIRPPGVYPPIDDPKAREEARKSAMENFRRHKEERNLRISQDILESEEESLTLEIGFIVDEEVVGNIVSYINGGGGEVTYVNLTDGFLHAVMPTKKIGGLLGFEVNRIDLVALEAGTEEDVNPSYTALHDPEFRREVREEALKLKPHEGIDE